MQRRLEWYRVKIIIQILNVIYFQIIRIIMKVFGISAKTVTKLHHFETCVAVNEAWGLTRGFIPLFKNRFRNAEGLDGLGDD